MGEVCVQQEMSSSGGEEASYRPNEADLMQIGQEFRDRFFLSDAEDSFCVGKPCVGKTELVVRMAAISHCH